MPSGRSRTSCKPAQRPLRGFRNDRIGVRNQGKNLRAERLIAAVSGRDQAVSHEPVASDPLDRRARELRPEPRIVERQQFRQRRRREFFARGKSQVAVRRLGKLVPRADGQAIVAAVDAAPDGFPELLRDRPGMLDRQVGDAAPCIEPVRRGKRIGSNRFVRNCLIAAGISGDQALRSQVLALVSDPDPVVSGTAEWALGRLTRSP